MSRQPWEAGDHPQRWQGYLDPDTGILRNLAGARSLEQLHTIEFSLFESRTIELRKNPVQATFDLAHVQRIHRHLFQDIYPWAGELRTVNMEKGRPFADVSMISGYGEYLAAEVRATNFLKESSREEFVDKLADFYNQLNDIHPFREGNGRSQRILWNQLADGAGKTIDWLQVEGGQVDRASERGRSGQLDELRAMFNQIVQDKSVPIAQTNQPDPRMMTRLERKTAERAAQDSSQAVVIGKAMNRPAQSHPGASTAKKPAKPVISAKDRQILEQARKAGVLKKSAADGSPRKATDQAAGKAARQAERGPEGRGRSR